MVTTKVCRSVLFSAGSPHSYKRESKQSNDAILSKLFSKSFSMSASQVPANAFAEPQAVLPTNQPLPTAAAQPGAVSQPWFRRPVKFRLK